MRSADVNLVKNSNLVNSEYSLLVINANVLASQIIDFKSGNSAYWATYTFNNAGGSTFDTPINSLVGCKYETKYVIKLPI